MGADSSPTRARRPDGARSPSTLPAPRPDLGSRGGADGAAAPSTGNRGRCAARLGKGEPRENRGSPWVAGQAGVSCEVTPEPLTPAPPRPGRTRRPARFPGARRLGRRGRRTMARLRERSRAPASRGAWCGGPECELWSVTVGISSAMTVSAVRRASSSSVTRVRDLLTASRRPKPPGRRALHPSFKARRGARPRRARHGGARGAPPSGRQDSAALPPSAEEDQQYTEQAEAGQRQCGHGLHGGVVGRGRGEGSHIVTGQVLERDIVVAGGGICVGEPRPPDPW